MNSTPPPRKPRDSAIYKINQEIERLHWTEDDVKNYLVHRYGNDKISLDSLSLLDLSKFLGYLKEQILPNPNNDDYPIKTTMQKPIQKIFFGCPGTGKSHKISNDIDGGIVKKILGIDKNDHPENLVKTVFHPEYTYGDFMGKLMPMTMKDGNNTSVYYQFYEGHFLKALAQAYKNIIEAKKVENAQNVALVIDEINRGNSSAIFGTVFQLLDRDQYGWSAYGIDISDL